MFGATVLSTCQWMNVPGEVLITNLIHRLLICEFAITLRALHHTVLFFVVLRIYISTWPSSQKNGEQPNLIPSCLRSKFLIAFAAFKVMFCLMVLMGCK